MAPAILFFAFKTRVGVEFFGNFEELLKKSTPTLFLFCWLSSPMHRWEKKQAKAA
jgi:hypothetical protein